ncbi:MAG: AzlD domain-containing protein [Rhizobiaceae bacterium]|nr:AzlD domain-containing protein [Rhizobiaceae bacterium]
MTFDAIDAWWWPFFFILIAGWLATDSWRFLGVFLGGRISEDSEALVFVRCVATALVAAVVAGLILTPNGALADTPILLRAGAAIAGFAAYLAAGKRMIVGIVVAEALLVGGVLWG